MTHRPSRALLLLLLLLPVLAANAPAGENSDMLESLRREAMGVTTITSSFTQEKHLSVFNDTVISEGHFFFQRPGRLRWEYTRPFRSGFVLDRDKGRRWDDLGGDRDVDLEHDPMLRVVAEQILAWTAFDLDTLRKQYEIEVQDTGPISLRLVPKSPALHEIVSHLLILFSDDGRSIARVEIHDADGDFTRLSFHDTRLNPDIPEGTF
ncbi:outer membrane lipoprotein carrier protein LolA [Paucidesulfovibrio longus]|uniref:outer membrane lipoprotein carrier protein LolA n=1 Tax=Paucidesulfovibrio longus TaxID=889 RepID=UPI0003B30A6E|nr:outer membrane lipoprotein carrier protein LolA [Paucidesulfovibrio longus]